MAERQWTEEELRKKYSRFQRDDPDGESGGTPVREPRRPTPKSPSGGAALPLPSDDELALAGC